MPIPGRRDNQQGEDERYTRAFSGLPRHVDNGNAFRINRYLKTKSKIRTDMTVKEFLILSDVASNATELLEQIGKLPKPDFVAGVRVPETLNDLTIGQLMELQSVRNGIDCIMVPCRVVLVCLLIR